MPDAAIIKKMIVKQYIGKQVLIRAADKSPLLVGIIKGFDGDGKPLIKDESSRMLRVSGIVIPYHPNIEQWLRSMSAGMQWDLLVGAFKAMQDLRMLRKICEAQPKEETASSVGSF